ncbi:immunoglobulin domain-containing protein oig-4-like [Cylas formicarius]|uniref:immunoglobulin domain-containing protein oig-4-like n=1 Tax=Cylas formicarius TaxID=197179 RepID=UPI0029588948|nr:immunoglobulin domain-containing protein oig-4-like [Cylas formicarius]
MHRNWFVVLTCAGIVLTCSGGRISGRGAKFGRGRLYHSRIPIVIQHRNQASVNYYENKDGAKIIKSSHFELEYMLGRKITFFCMAQGLPRPEITWFKDGIELYHHKYFQVHEWQEGNDTIKSKMEIDPATQKDAGFYQCQANNKYAIDSRAFRTDYAMLTY